MEPAADPTSSLVRLIQDYRLDELVEPDHDRAMAGELVFSLWIRRRDAHPWNRAYVAGVPGFVDHHIAFGAEPENRSLDGFFRPGADAGYTSRWRVHVLPAGHHPTTRSERALIPIDLAIHRVRRRDEFERHLDAAVGRIERFGREEIHTLAQRAGAPQPGEVTEFLLHWMDELPEALRRLRDIIDSP